MTNQPQEILHVLQLVGDPVGGIRKHIHSIIEGLDEKQFRSSYAYSTTRVDSRFTQEIKKLRGRLLAELTLRVKKRPHPGDIINLWKLARFVKKNQIDIVHGHGAKGGLYARLVGKICNIPAVYTPHGGVAHGMFGFWEDHLYTFIERCLAKFTQCFIFESQYTAKSFMSKVGKIPCPWLVNYNGIPSSSLAKVKETIVTDWSKINIGVFGVLRREKGQTHLINAVAATAISGQKNLRLHIFGDGPDLDTLKNQVVELGLTGKVTFYGDISNPEQEMAKMNIIAIPSLFESFGYVGLEAMALGKPVIASAVGGLLEIFDSETALLVPPGDDVALSKAIIRLIQNSELSDSMARRGSVLCEERFSLYKMIKTLSDQYRKVVHY